MTVDITEWIVRIPVLLFAITIHEYGHGKAALSLGDPTAKEHGRLTLNPLSHLDPLGAVCLFLFNFGWAKPVPVDPRYFKKPRRDIVLMSLSGPISNLAAALVAGIFVRYFDTSALKDCLRISVGKPEDTDALVRALKEVNYD